MTRFLAAAPFAALLALAACSKPEPPEKDRPPEPQAATQAASREPPATELREYMQAPINRAKGAEQTVLDAAEQQRAAIDAQAAGAAATTTPAQ